MSREEAIEILKGMKYPYNYKKNKMIISNVNEETEALEMAISALSQEPCDDVVSRQAVLDELNKWEWQELYLPIHFKENIIDVVPPVTQKSGKCKNCKYFEYDSVAKVDGIPLIVAHEICNKWGDGCKTSEDGYCYLFEPQESEE